MEAVVLGGRQHSGEPGPSFQHDMPQMSKLLSLQTSTADLQKQAAQEEAGPSSSIESKELQTKDTQGNPEIPVATQDPGLPGPFHGKKRTCCLKLPRLHRKRVTIPK